MTGASLTALAGAALTFALAAPSAAHAQVDVAEAGIEALQQEMASGRLTSERIVEAYLARIHAYDGAGPGLNAILHVNPNALAEARALDVERATRGPRGPLHGIPIVVKDNIDVLGLPTSAGSLALAGLYPPDDAFQVRRLREAGAVVLAKTNMHELAGGITTRGSLGGQTLNPYDLTRNPGGSSGGTAVAVTASFATIGWGTDACGSLRVPASQNNVVALRATKGLSSVDGVLPLAHSEDVAGPIARTVRDLAIALDATVGFDPTDPATEAARGRGLPSFVEALDPVTLRGARIGVLSAFFGSAPEDQAAAAVVQRALREMATLGATPVAVEIDGLEEMIARAVVMGDEFKWDLSDYLEGVPGAPVRSLRDLLALGLVDEELIPYLRLLDASPSRISPEYLDALSARAHLQGAVVAAMDSLGLDALVYPTLLRIPSHVDDPQWGSNCRLSSSTGLPTLTVPAGFTDRGLPIGVELLGRPFEDARLVALGYAYEQGTDHRRPPPAAPALVAGGAPAPLVLEVVADGDELDIEAPSRAHAVARFTVDAVMGRLEWTFEVTGVPAEDVYAVALRSRDGSGQWSVVRRLAGPGVASGSGVFTLDAALRSRIERGELYLDVFTRARPFGAARGRLGPLVIPL